MCNFSSSRDSCRQNVACAIQRSQLTGRIGCSKETTERGRKERGCGAGGRGRGEEERGANCPHAGYLEEHSICWRNEGQERWLQNNWRLSSCVSVWGECNLIPGSLVKRCRRRRGSRIRLRPRVLCVRPWCGEVFVWDVHSGIGQSIHDKSLREIVDTL